MRAGRNIIAVLDGTAAGEGTNPQVLSCGSEIAGRTGGRLFGVLLGSQDALASDDAIAADAAALGLSEAFVLREPWLAEYQAEAYLHALSLVCRQLNPGLILFSHNSISQEVAPRLAARLRAALVTDCVGLDTDADGKTLVATGLSFSGKALAEWALDREAPAIVTLRRQAGSNGAGGSNHSCTVVTRAVDEPPALRSRLRGRVSPPAGELRLEDADVVVAVGRGVGSAEAFQAHVVDGLARTLGAACGGSRGAVDSGIIRPELQIGLTGRVVSPKLYIAVGLSGSPQHMAGCSGAQTLVAVNTDSQAPIFGFAHYGVVGDYREVIPAMTAQFQEMAEAARAPRA